MKRFLIVLMTCLCLTVAVSLAVVNFVLVPKENKPDIKELDKEITDGLKITFVENMNEVLERALA